MAGTVPTDYHGVVWCEVAGGTETAAALNEIATKFPQLFKQALAAEVSNLKKSIAATLKNYQVLKAVPVPNLIEAVRWKGYKLAKKSPVTKVLQGAKHISHLAKPGSVSIQSIPGGFEVGHFGGLAKYAIRFQDGVPRFLPPHKAHKWMYPVLNKGGYVAHDAMALETLLAPVSPPRPYIGVLAEKCGRDFVPGLVKCFEKIASGEMKKAQPKK